MDRGVTRCAVAEALLAARVELERAVTVGVLAMSLTNMKMTPSATAVTTVSSQSISRRVRRRLRRLRCRAEAALSRTSESQPGEGIPIRPG